MTQSSPQYLVRYDGGIVDGPLTRAELLNHIQSGLIRPTNHIKEDGGAWVSLSTRPDLFEPASAAASTKVPPPRSILQADVTKWLALGLMILGGFLMAVRALDDRALPGVGTGASFSLGVGFPLALAGLILRVHASRSRA